MAISANAPCASTGANHSCSSANANAALLRTQSRRSRVYGSCSVGVAHFTRLSPARKAACAPSALSAPGSTRSRRSPPNFGFVFANFSKWMTASSLFLATGGHVQTTSQAKDSEWASQRRTSLESTPSSAAACCSDARAAGGKKESSTPAPSNSSSCDPTKPPPMARMSGWTTAATSALVPALGFAPCGAFSQCGSDMVAKKMVYCSTSSCNGGRGAVGHVGASGPARTDAISVPTSSRVSRRYAPQSSSVSSYRR
mmetsp:Transcript_16935/g.57295  ORF Transcript_16935/g.57295 Transcript_16935/m.57295 type:complete len:256 (-) Transcript_16935:409-1176(-)